MVELIVVLMVELVIILIVILIVILAIILVVVLVVMLMIILMVELVIVLIMVVVVIVVVVLYPTKPKIALTVRGSRLYIVLMVYSSIGNGYTFLGSFLVVIVGLNPIISMIA